MKATLDQAAKLLTLLSQANVSCDQLQVLLESGVMSLLAQMNKDELVNLKFHVGLAKMVRKLKAERKYKGDYLSGLFEDYTSFGGLIGGHSLLDNSKVKCIWCGELIALKEWENHMRTCPKIPASSLRGYLINLQKNLRCRHCGAMFQGPSAERDLEKHEERCPLNPNPPKGKESKLYPKDDDSKK